MEERALDIMERKIEKKAATFSLGYTFSLTLFDIFNFCPVKLSAAAET